MVSAEFEAKVQQTIRRRRKTDLKAVIREVLACPTLDPGDVVEVDGDMPLTYYLDKNVDVMSRIVIRQALAAGNGDLKSAEFLMKYGAYTPAQETTLTVIPTIIDDLGCLPVQSKALKAPMEDEDIIDITPEEQ